MISTTKEIRTAYYQALNGNLSINGQNVPVVDGWDNAQSLVMHHVIIKNVTDSRRDRTQQTWGFEVIVELDIVTFQHNGFSSDDRDDIENQILTILMPTPNTIGISVTGFGLYNMEKESSRPIDEIGRGGNIARKILRISQFIQQL